MRRFLIITGIVVALLLAGLSFVLTSRTGLQWTAQQIGRWSGGTVTVRESSGTFASSPGLLDLRVSLPGAEISVGLLEIDWLPARLLRGSLHFADIRIETVRVDLKKSGETKSSSPAGNVPPELHVPFPFLISSLTLKDMVIRGIDETVLLEVNDLSSSLSGTLTELEIDRLAVRTPEYGFDISGSQSIDAPWDTAIAGSWWALAPGCERFEGWLNLRGSLENPDVSVTVQRPVMVSVSGSFSDLLETPSWNLKGLGKGIALDEVCRDFPALKLYLEAESTGTLADYRGKIEAGAEFDDGLGVSLAADLGGTRNGLHSVIATIESAGNSGQVRGSVDWHETLSWQAEADLPPADLAPFGLPQGFTIGGRINSQGSLVDGELKYTAELSNLRGSSSSPPVEFGGTIELEGDAAGLNVTSSQLRVEESDLEVNGSVNWQDGLSWEAEAELTPLDLSGFGLPPGLAIGGKLRSEGGLAGAGLSYTASLSDLLVTSSNPSLEFGGTLQLKGDAAGLVVTSSLLRAEQSELEVTGNFGWLGGISWDARLRLEQFNPAILTPMADGSVDALVRTWGSLAGKDSTIEAVIDSLSGSFRDHELTGEGQIGYRDNRFAAENLFIRNGENILEVNGTVGDQLGVSFSFTGAELQQLTPDLEGRINISGTVSGYLTEPVVQLEGTGHGLMLPGYRADLVSLQASLGPTEPYTFDIRGEISDLSVQDWDIKEINVQLEGDPAEHTIELDLHSDTAAVSLSGGGGLRDWSRWQGVLEGIILEHDMYGSWYQEGSMNVDAGADGATLENLCMYSATGSICGSGSWMKPGDWSLDVPELQFLLGELYRWKLLEVPINGEVTGRIRVAGNNGVITTAAAAMEIPEWSMNLELGELAQDFRWFDTTLSLEQQDDTLNLEADSRFVDGSRVGGNLIVHGFSDLSGPFTSLALEGSVVADILDLTPLTPITSDYLVPSGHIEADMRFGGTVGAPLISGDVGLSDGALRFPQLGIAFTDLKGGLRGQGRSLDIWLEGTSAGEQAHIEGRLDFSGDDWYGRFTGIGADLELMNQSELRVVGTPDIVLEIGPAGGHLTGKIQVPEARLAPEEMVDSAAESGDVVFVDVEETDSDWPFTFNLEISLGDDVRVQGYGLDGRLVGKLQANQNQAGLQTGRGEINVADGRFALFGSFLNISRGRIIFSGGTLDNPGLDISARKIVRADRGGSDEIIVGANITGTVHDYRVDLFSIPAMEDRDILAYILLDTAFVSSDSGSKGIVDRALASMGVSGGNALFSGVTEILPVDEMHFVGGLTGDNASLVVGKSLTERLSVSYDFNLFKNAGLFRVRYEFGRGFSVQSRNSFESNGIEFLYSFER